jgi:predicted nucleic acid-binding protein
VYGVAARALVETPRRRGTSRYAFCQKAVDEGPDAARTVGGRGEILAGRDVALSVQVLQEFYVQATGDGRPDPLSHEHTTQLIESFLRFPVQDITTDVMRAALTTRERFGISYWDAAIIEAGRALGCDVVLSEDLSDGEDYAGIRVENPFRGR